MIGFLHNIIRGHCTLWPDKIFVDYSLSCLAHDIAYTGGFKAKLKGDWSLLLDVWATAVVAEKWWQRAILRANAVLMYAGVSTFGTLIWLRKKL